MTTLIEQAQAEPAPDGKHDNLCVPFHCVDAQGNWQPVGLLLNGLCEAIIMGMEELRSQIRKIEKRIELKDMTFTGKFQKSRKYKRGQAVMYKDNLYVALVDNPKDQPAIGAEWQLRGPR